MSVSEADIAFAKELFHSMPSLTTRKMMGGLCLYSSGTIFALIHSDGVIYLKGKGDFADLLEKLGATRWTYQRESADKPTTMPYWTLPDAALDDPEYACKLARDALQHLES